MTNYTLTISRRARKQLARIPETDRNRLIEKFDVLQQDPFPVSCKKLRGARNIWRIRQGDYRVVYTVEGETVTVISVGHRSDVYRQ